MIASVLASPAMPPPSIEELAFHFGTDKSRDDHGYTDVYALLFDHMREAVHNVTEVGAKTGQSLQLWHAYFPNALIYGLDIVITRPALHRVSKLPRARLIKANSQSQQAVSMLPMAPGTQDVIIDDGDHSANGTQRTLLAMWPLLKPGGIYVIEDIITGTGDGCEHYRCSHPINAPLGGQAVAPLIHTPGWRQPQLQARDCHLLPLLSAVAHSSVRSSLHRRPSWKRMRYSLPTRS